MIDSAGEGLSFSHPDTASDTVPVEVQELALRGRAHDAFRRETESYLGSLSPEIWRHMRRFSTDSAERRLNQYQHTANTFGITDESLRSYALREQFVPNACTRDHNMVALLQRFCNRVQAMDETERNLRATRSTFERGLEVGLGHETRWGSWNPTVGVEEAAESLMNPVTLHWYGFRHGEVYAFEDSFDNPHAKAAFFHAPELNSGNDADDQMKLGVFKRPVCDIHLDERGGLEVDTTSLIRIYKRTDVLVVPQLISGNERYSGNFLRKYIERAASVTADKKTDDIEVDSIDALQMIAAPAIQLAFQHRDEQPAVYSLGISYTARILPHQYSIST